jgi:hypothetical protein
LNTIQEIAKAKKINPSYVSRLLRLTLLAPATVQAILDGRAAAAPTLANAMMDPFSLKWSEQSYADAYLGLPLGEHLPAKPIAGYTPPEEVDHPTFIGHHWLRPTTRPPPSHRRSTVSTTAPARAGRGPLQRRSGAVGEEVRFGVGPY